jgi:hypothetical protein
MIGMLSNSLVNLASLIEGEESVYVMGEKSMGQEITLEY